MVPTVGLFENWDSHRKYLTGSGKDEAKMQWMLAVLLFLFFFFLQTDILLSRQQVVHSRDAIVGPPWRSGYYCYSYYSYCFKTDLLEPSCFALESEGLRLYPAQPLGYNLRQDHHKPFRPVVSLFVKWGRSLFCRAAAGLNGVGSAYEDA